MAEFALSGWLLSEWMRSGFSGCWLLWSRLFFYFLPHFLLCVSFCLIFPASSSSRVLSSHIFPIFLFLFVFSTLCFPLFPIPPLSFFFLSFLPSTLYLFISYFPPMSVLFCFSIGFFFSYLHVSHSHALLSTLSFLFILLSHFFKTIFLSLFSSFYMSFFLLFSIFISPPHLTLSLFSLSSSPFLLLALCFPVLPSRFLSVFCLYPHLSPFLPPSLLSLCFCACCFSILCREHSCDANYIDWRKGERKREGGRERGREDWKTCACTKKHKYTHSWWWREWIRGDRGLGGEVEEEELKERRGRGVWWKRGRAGRKRAERNWRRENPSVSVIVSRCRTRGNSLTAEGKRER